MLFEHMRNLRLRLMRVAVWSGLGNIVLSVLGHMSRTMGMIRSGLQSKKLNENAQEKKLPEEKL